MVRAGEGAYLIDHFERAGYVAVGWEEINDVSDIQTQDALREKIRKAYPDMIQGALGNSVAMLFKFRSTMRRGDAVVSGDSQRREYLLGTIESDYQYKPGLIPDSPHVRKVAWSGRVSRDALTPSSRNTLGSTLTIFEPGLEVLTELRKALQAGRASVQTEEDVEEAEAEFEVIRRDTLGRAHEFIKDRIRSLTPAKMEELTAALLRGMGYRARVTLKGPDRGRDVTASPDGLGFQTPRIMAEVKHRPGQAMGAPEVRAFVGGLRDGDRGLFVSTGGFSKEAHYEAERASVPITLVDLDALAALVVEHYERFDMEGRALVPLVRVYWPVA